ncbi:MAG TPA: bifunctional UDP-N-acetylglucosamine diphosphorylase/glucosamine-1-phosphate N-acetyltransferase GlmU [Pyrinomonadaceae bacterium]|nr:bifunctional UDP-N-acetylglucosamine diphosphorylase/glucosamine-1-phosphate N-acetyltransferase GlmU [Pyrinomonadaceae bacterium]HMP63946.1 bifunctional UDP-N-acetylglucosamine diphosphorylase/glucosamine-1-phosphate N-acetyltransferase GlmU [Pyrinomonadaceae bacterium]
MGVDERPQKPIDVLILAAGLGTRMRSGLAKVLHKLGGRPLINHVCHTAAALAPEKVFIVIGHQGDDVKSAVLSELEPQLVDFVLQKEQLGTGDAVNAARGSLEGRDSTLLILSGDVPLIRHETLASMIRQHATFRGRGAACTILTVRLKDPAGYGRVVRNDEGTFEKIVEQKDATEDEQAIDEINAGIYCFDTGKLFAALTGVKNNNAQGEYYLTDVPRLLKEAGEDVAIFKHSEAREIEGVNNRAQLAAMERILNRQTVSRLMLDHGVTFIDPKSVYISDRAKFGRDTVVYPNVTVEGEAEIGDGCVIRSGTRIANAKIGRDVEILDNCLIVDSEVGDLCKVGPMAHLRGKAVMLEGAKVGNFVELKKTRLGRGSKASHLSYLGDATIGEKTNIGAGTITCNYDGKNKHESHIGDNVKIGSDTMLVAPVTVGDGASTGAGSVVTKDVEPDTLVVGVPAMMVRKSRSKSEESDN